MMIAAFDLATVTGCCHGQPNGVPLLWTWWLRDGGDSRPARLCYLRRLLDKYFAETPIDEVWYEEPMDVGVLMRVGSRSETVILLNGAIGVLESCALHAGKTLRSVSVQDARQALTGRRTFRRVTKGKSEAKEAVMRAARYLGADPKNDNEGDAYAVWNYACAMSNPRTAHLSTPLFAGR